MNLTNYIRLGMPRKSLTNKNLYFSNSPMTLSSDITGFYKLSPKERLSKVSELVNLNSEDERLISNGGLTLEEADAMRENVIGLYSLPLSVATNFTINNKDYLIPMVGEEPSVVAGASKAAKIARGFGGFKAHSTEPIMIGEIHIVNPDDDAVEVIEANNVELVKEINDMFPSMVSRGGGAREVWARNFTSGRGKSVVVYFSIDVRDAMGANTINKAAEQIAPRIIELIGGYINMRILTNLSIKRITRASAVLSVDKELNERIIDGNIFAMHDIFRAVTHNKGIMNGITSLALATGNDTRATEAAIHGYASYSSFYRPLTSYYVEDNKLVGEIEVPLSLGIVGSGTNHKIANLCINKILQVKSSPELCNIAASLGLAQNFAAMNALTKEGINKGHMRLHSKTLALMNGATPEQASKIYEHFKDKENEISMSEVKRLLEELKSGKDLS